MVDVLREGVRQAVDDGLVERPVGSEGLASQVRQPGMDLLRGEVVQEGRDGGHMIRRWRCGS